MALRKTAAELLGEIRSETAQQLMNSILYETDPLGSTGLPGLDAHLLSHASHHRASSSASLNRGDVLEIQGSAASGKTQLLYHLAMKCILPYDTFLTFSGDSISHLSRTIYIGGWGKAAIIIDTDGRWSMQRLKHLIVKRLENLYPPDHEKYKPGLEELISESLRRVHVFRPTSSLSLAATLLRLPLYLEERVPDHEMSLLAIDSISSFYWIDRYNAEKQHNSVDQKGKYTESPLSHVLKAIQELRLMYGQVTVLTNWGILPVSKASVTHTQGATQEPGNSPFYKQHLHPFPSPFEIPPRILTYANLYPPITYHITLPPLLIPSISAEVGSLEDAKKVDMERETLLKTKDTVGVLRIVEGGYTGTFTFRILEDEIVGRSSDVDIEN